MSLKSFLLILLVAVSPLVRSDVFCHQEDLNGDGISEIILENEFVRVAFTTGEVNARRFREGHSGKERLAYAYDRRFLWGGWLWDYVWKPTNTQMCLRYDGRYFSWHGIPECFEEVVVTSEIRPGLYRLMVPGMGVGTGPGRCLSWSLRDMVYFPWTSEIWCEADGKWKRAAGGRATAWKLKFRHEIKAENGYGCAYEKTVTLRQGSSRLDVQRVLRNTGSKGFQTQWFTHGFWAQGKNGRPDSDCWSTVPLRFLHGKDKLPSVDTESCFWQNMPAPSYWGSVSGEDVADSWSVAGNQSNGIVLVECVDRKIAFYRFWMDLLTYSCEPFLFVNVGPGEEYRWGGAYIGGQGLTSVKAKGAGALVDWKVKHGEQGCLQVKVLPYERRNGRVKLRGTLELPDTDRIVKVDLISEQASWGPGKPATFSMPMPSELMNSKVEVKLDGYFAEKAGGEERLFVIREQRRLQHIRELPGVEQGAVAVVIGGKKLNKKRKWITSDAGHYWYYALKACGFEVHLVPADAGTDMIDWEHLSLAISVTPKIKPDTIRHLETFVSNGGGFLQCGPVNMDAFVDVRSDLLPIDGALGTVSLDGLIPRDGTRNFVEVDGCRYQLWGKCSHPVLKGLPLYPESKQSIGLFQMVEPKQDANVLAWLVPGSKRLGTDRYPGLISRGYGKGNVAMTAFPSDWGMPNFSVKWARFGEYQRRFLRQLAWWARGKTIVREKACRESEKLEEDGYDWYRRHRDKCSAVKKTRYDVIMIGDSITHYWEHRYGPKSWKKLVDGRKVLNLGFGWDRTCNVLWRLKHGELAGQTPKFCVVLIGTNNLSTTKHYQGDSPAETAAGIKAVVRAVRRMTPDTQVVLMKVLPRGNASCQAKIDQVNEMLEIWLKEDNQVILLDLKKSLCKPDGGWDASNYMPNDKVHLNEKGYESWLKALENVFKVQKSKHN